MSQGYCSRCRAQKEIADAVEEEMKNGRTAVKGKCPACGVVVFKIFDGKTPEVNAASDPVDFPESPDMPT
jgi:uncharacterized Zn finger protein (UPF0148 family)